MVQAEVTVSKTSAWKGQKGTAYYAFSVTYYAMLHAAAVFKYLTSYAQCYTHLISLC